MIRSFLQGISLCHAGESRPLSSDLFAALFTARETGEVPEDSAEAAIVAEVEARIERFVEAGGTADGTDWHHLSELEQALLAEALVRLRNRERGLLVHALGQVLGAPEPHLALPDDDADLARIKARQALLRRAIAFGGGPQ